MKALNILINWYTLKPKHYIKAFGFDCRRIETYRLIHVLLLTLNSHGGLIVADLKRMFKGTDRTYIRLMALLQEHDLINYRMIKRKCNLPGVIRLNRSWYTSVKGREALKSLADDMQAIFDKLSKPHDFL